MSTQHAAARFGQLLKMGWRAGVDRSFDLVFPPRCAVCSVDLIDANDRILICPDCRKQMVATQPACPRCACHVPNVGQPDCVQCRDAGLRFNASVRMGDYRDALRRAILRIKQSSERALATALGDLLAISRHDELRQLDVDVVVPVPLHWRRRLLRGHNSAAVLAERIANSLNKPMASFLLARRRYTRPQFDLPPGSRWDNVRGAFQVTLHEDLPDARVLLVDDILTTGATSSEIAKVLRKAGASFIAVCVLARAEGTH